MRHLIVAPFLLILVGCGARQETEIAPQATSVAPQAPQKSGSASLPAVQPATPVRSSAAPSKPTASVMPDEGPVGWIRTLGDVQLAALVAEALEHGGDPAQVSIRMGQAQERARQAVADLGPTAAFAAGVSGDATVGEGLNRALGAGTAYTWEVDLWRRVAAPDALVIPADVRAMRESLAASVAKAVILARLTVVQDVSGRALLAEQEKLVKVRLAQQAAGRATDADLAVARNGLDEALQRLTEAGAAREQAIRSLETLLGRQPTGMLSPGDTLPMAPLAPPAGIASQVLERRPDLTAANRRVALAFNQPDGAKAARVPRVPLTTALGTASTELTSLTIDGGFWQAGGNFVGPLREGNRLMQVVVIDQPAQREALAAYGQVALQAFRQVENRLGDEIRQGQRVVAAQELLATCSQALAAAGQKPAGDGGGDEAVVPARMQELRAQALVQALRADQLTARIDLFLILGGGFTPPAPTADDQAPQPVVEAR